MASKCIICGGDCSDCIECSSCGEPICKSCNEAGEQCPCTIDDDAEDDDEDLIDGVGFADPNGRSALRAETPDNPRIYPCPTCGAKDVLTRIDVERGYQCDDCADRAEGRGD